MPKDPPELMRKKSPGHITGTSDKLLEKKSSTELHVKSKHQLEKVLEMDANPPVIPSQMENEELSSWTCSGFFTQSSLEN